MSGMLATISGVKVVSVATPRNVRTKMPNCPRSFSRNPTYDTTRHPAIGPSRRGNGIPRTRKVAAPAADASSARRL